MSKRSDLPLNREMDAHRAAVRYAFLEYLTNRTGREEKKAIFKEALREIFLEGLQEFGWFSLKAIALAAFVAIMYLWLQYSGWTHK